MPSRYSQGVAGIFFSTGSRLLSSRFTGSRWVILLNGFQNIVQQIHRESLGYSSQRVPDYCPVDSEGFAGSFFSAGSRLLSSRFTGSRCVILLNGFQTNVQQIFTGSRLDFLLNGFQTVVLQIHRESRGYSSQRVPDYCPVGSQGVAGSFFSTGSRLLFRRLTGLAGLFFPTGSRQLSSRDSQGVAGLFFSPGSRPLSGRCSQGVVGLFFSTGSRLLSSRFTGTRWVIPLNGFQTIVQQIHRESLGYSSQRVPDYCPVGSQGVAGSFFSTGSRLLSNRFTGSRWVILLNGSTAIVQQILRESLGYSSQRVLDYCPVYSQGAAGLFFSTASRLLSSRFSGSRWVILLNGFQTNVQQIFTGSRWDFLLNGFQTIVKQIHWESLGYSSQRVPDYCPVDSEGFA